MFLRIENPDGLDLSDFCNYLIDLIIDYANNPNNVNTALADKWTEYFNSTDLGWVRDVSDNAISPSFYVIVNLYFDELYYYELNGAYFITSDPNQLLNSTRLTIDSLATMINDGTIGMKGYSYFDQVFNYFAGNLKSIFENYVTQYGG